jgi:hypothetical protein
MADDGNPGDAALVRALAPKQADAWRALVELDEDFRARPHADDDCVWPERPGQMPYPEYGSRVQARCCASVTAGSQLRWPAAAAGSRIQSSSQAQAAMINPQSR